MIGVHRRDDGRLGEELQEGAVEFVGFGDDDRIVRHQQVGAVVLGNAAEEGGAALAAVRQDMGDQGARRGFPMGAGNGQAALVAGDFAQDPGTLEQLVPLLADIDHLAEVLRNGRGPDDEGSFDILRDPVGVIGIVDHDTFRLQLLGQVRRRLVIAADSQAFAFPVAGDGTHADAADSEEIYLFVLHIT